MKTYYIYPLYKDGNRDYGSMLFCVAFDEADAIRMFKASINTIEWAIENGMMSKPIELIYGTVIRVNSD